MLEILKFPNPRLKEKAEPVTEFTPWLHRLLDQMAEAMYAANGIGLAAIQVGEPLRLFVIDAGSQEDQPRKLHEFVNPRLSGGQGKIAFEEGCLSVPGYTDEVQRKERILVDYQDRHGQPQRMAAEGLM